MCVCVLCQMCKSVCVCVCLDQIKNKSGTSHDIKGEADTSLGSCVYVCVCVCLVVSGPQTVIMTIWSLLCCWVLKTTTRVPE